MLLPRRWTSTTGVQGLFSGRNRTGQLLWLFLVVFAVKAILFAVDHRPGLFLGDSQSYLYTALTGYIPDDRSFVYGYFLRYVALWPHSIVCMAAVHTALSAVSTWLLGFCLLRYAKARWSVALTAALLCAVEPLELLYERFMMTETLATFLFCIYFVLCAEFVRAGKIYVIGCIQIVAVCLISIRISFLPLILILTVVLPFLRPRPEWHRILSALITAVVISQCLLSGYRTWNGALLKREPAYLYRDGVLLLGAFSPIVKPEDYPIVSQRKAIFDGLKTDVPFPTYRVYQTWDANGLCNRVLREVKDSQKANVIAQQTAIHAARRDPAGILMLAVRTFGEYMHTRRLRGFTYIDELRNDPFPLDVTKTLHDRLHFQATENDTETPVMRWHAYAVRWYQFILWFCLLSPLLLLLVGRDLRRLTCVGVICCFCFLVGALLPVDHTIPRYLTTAAWMVLFLLAITVEAGWHRLRNYRTAREEHSQVPVSSSVVPDLSETHRLRRALRAVACYPDPR
jgi:hypothetical protein